MMARAAAATCDPEGKAKRLAKRRILAEPIHIAAYLDLLVMGKKYPRLL